MNHKEVSSFKRLGNQDPLVDINIQNSNNAPIGKEIIPIAEVAGEDIVRDGDIVNTLAEDVSPMESTNIYPKCSCNLDEKVGDDIGSLVSS